MNEIQPKKPKSKFDSRKYRTAQQCIVLTILIPILFKYIQISDSITQNVLIQIAALGLAYGGLNVFEKKIIGKTNEPE